MRKWRPAPKCLYVIPEIHGAIDLLKIILNRIVPFRFSEGQEDRIVFLGNYIDKGEHSADVIALLLELREYEDFAVSFLKGNCEDFLLRALKDKEDYNAWMQQGGTATVQSYLRRAGMDLNPALFPFSRLSDLFPREHLDFLEALPSHLISEGYRFFQGGVNLQNPTETGSSTFIYDAGASRDYKESKQKGIDLLSNDLLVNVGSSNYKSKRPVIYPRYFMLGGSAPRDLILFEVNSMTCAMVKSGKSRIYKHQFKLFE